MILLKLKKYNDVLYIFSNKTDCSTELCKSILIELYPKDMITLMLC